VQHRQRESESSLTQTPPAPQLITKHTHIPYYKEKAKQTTFGLNAMWELSLSMDLGERQLVSPYLIPYYHEDV